MNSIIDIIGFSGQTFQYHPIFRQLFDSLIIKNGNSGLLLGV